MFKVIVSAIFSVAASFFALPAHASLKDIQTAKLPPDAAISKAYADASSVEPMAHEWHDVWPYSTPKENVASLLKSAMSALQEATLTRPDNEELWLLAGLVGHYAYNVDVDGSYELAMKSFQSAHRLSPEDYRPDWFQAALVCQTPQSTKGMQSFLALESLFSWEKLAIGFWDDYLACTIVTVMPAHSLRALDHLHKLQPEQSDYRNALADIARKRIKTSDTSGSYSQNEVWSSENLKHDVELTNTMAGLRFSFPENWNLRLFDVQNGQSLAQMEMPPFKVKAMEVSPNILIIARPPKAGETLGDFLKSWMKYPSSNSIKIQNCPSHACLALQGLEPGTYAAAGDGFAILVAFERERPEFPGIQFEQPLSLPEPTEGKPPYFRPTLKMGRLSGTLYYVIMLDAATSVREPASSAFEVFLKGVQVE